MNKQLKAYTTRHASSSFSKCLSSILEYIKTNELNKVYVSTIQANKKTNKHGHYSRENSTINMFYENLSKPIASWLEDQLVRSQHHPYSFDKTETETQYVVKIEKNEYIVQNVSEDTISCSCYEHLSLNLPCRHIFYLRRELELDLFKTSMIPKRHKIDNQLIEVTTDMQTLVTSVENMNSLPSLTDQNMTEKTRYNTAFRIAQELCNSMKKLDGERYTNALKRMLELKSSIDREIYDNQAKPITTNETCSNIRSETSTLNEDILTAEEHCGDDDVISSSQSSVSSTSSTYSVIGKRIINAPKIGRKKKEKKTLITGRLSSYASGLNDINEEQIKSNSESNVVSSKNTKFNQRSREFLE